MRWFRPGLIFLFPAILSHPLHANMIADRIDEHSKKIFISDMGAVKNWDSEFSNAWISQNAGFYSGSGDSIFNYIENNATLITGKNMLLSLCTIDEKSQTDFYERCQDKPANKEIGITLDDVGAFKMLDPGFSVVFPSLRFDPKSKENALYLSKGEVLPVGEKSAVFALSLDGGDAYKILDQEAATWYRISHYAGLARASEMFGAGKKFGDVCNTVLGEPFYCDPSESGPYAVTGMLLRDFAAICTTCDPKSRAVLSYYATDYLLRVRENTQIKEIAYKLMFSNEDVFEANGLNTERLTELYRWSLAK
ncbi:hypothetical protein D3C87_378430 [compost metagenome]